MRIFRIRKNFLASNGNVYVFEADVLENSASAALEAAEAGTVHNWKWLDKIDRDQVESTETTIEYLKPVARRYARSPAKPGDFNWKERTVKKPIENKHLKKYLTTDIYTL